MPWEDIANTLSRLSSELLEGLYNPIIANAESNPDQELELTTEQLEAIDQAAIEADIELTETAIEDFPEDVANPSAITNSSAVIAFFLRKQIVDGISAIHSATIATQIDEADRADSQQASLDKALTKINSSAQSESSSSFALKHRDIAIDSDFSYYRYITSEDNVVRPEHRSRSGKIFIYGQERTVDDVPGLANRCRCFSDPLTREEALQGEFYYPGQRPSETQAKVDSMKKKELFEIKAFKGNVSIDVVGDIDEWDLNSYEYFSEKVNSYLDSDDQELIINITSHGGIANDGIMAYKLLKSLPNKVTCNIYGYVGSAATFFAMAADYTTIGENDTFFIHQAWSCPCGNKEELQEAISSLDNVDEIQVSMYASKTGLTDEQIKDLMARESVIDAQTAKDLGFVDEIRADSKRSRVARGDISAQANKSAILALQQTSKEGETMKIEDILAYVKEKATDSDKDQLLGALDGVAKQDSENAVAEVQAKLEEANVQVAAKESVIQASSSNKIDLDAERETIRAEVKAEYAKEAETKATLLEEVEKAGLKVEGTDSNEIMANAIEQAGGKVADKEGTLFSSEVLAQIWAGVSAFRTVESNNQQEINALGSESGEIKKSLAGSRADRINRK